MLFETILRHPPKQIALRDASTTICYGDLTSAMDGYVQRLSGVRVLGIALDNSAEWILWDLAALKAGIVCVPLPPFFTHAQTQHAIKSAGISHIITPHGLSETGAVPSGSIPAGTAKITYTSGSTGNPKGVCLPQKAIEDVASSIAQLVGHNLQHHSTILPLAVLLENIAGVYTALIAGSAICFTSLRDFGKNYECLHEILQKTQANSAILVPELLRILMLQASNNAPLAAMRFLAVGGAKVDSTQIAQARHLGLPVYEGYGLSECASVVALNTPEHDMPGTVGKMLPHVQLAIQNGEIMIEHPGFLGYVGEPAPDVFATGDLGNVDAMGFITLHGRRKNLLITSYGRNVSPEWVESALLAQPEIAQALIYGDGHATLSALLVPSHAAANLSAAVMRTNATLPEYARILDFTIVPPFTQENELLTGNGRIRRDAILTAHIQSKTKEMTHEFLSNVG